MLQRDIFFVLARARRLTRADSQVFEDSVELQKIYMKARDQYGEKGARIVSKVNNSCHNFERNLYIYLFSIGEYIKPDTLKNLIWKSNSCMPSCARINKYLIC